MIQPDRHFRSLATKLVVPILAGSLLGIVLLGYAITAMVSNRLQANLTERAYAVAHMLNYTAEVDLDLGKLQRVVNSLGAEQNVEIITIIAGTPKTVLASTRNEWIGKPLESLPEDFLSAFNQSKSAECRDQHQFTTWGDSLLCRVPLLLTQRHDVYSRGSVVVVVDTTAMRHQERRLVAAILMALSGGIALAALALWVLVWSLVLRPVNRISDMIQAGERVDAIPIKRNDELGVLAATLRAKTLAQREAEARLEAVNLELQEHNKRIHAERRLLDTIINSVPHAIFWKDKESRYLGCNESFAKVGGLSDPQQLVGKNDYQMPWAPEAEHYRTCDQQVMNGERIIVNLEEPLTGPDGEERVLLTSKTPLLNEDQQVIGMIGVFNDVTEFKKAEAERDRLLIESAELAQIIREAPNEVFLFRQSDWRFIVVNKGACQKIGLSEEGMLNLSFLDLQAEFDESRFQALLEPLVDGTVSHLEYQTQMRREQGTTFPVQVRLHATEYQGQPVFVAFASDLTEVKELERQLAQAQKMESLGQLSAGIAHELNTPMQAVVSNVEFLTETTEELLDSLSFLIKACQRNDVGQADWLQQIEEVSQKRTLQFGIANMPGAIADIGVAASQVVRIVQAMRAVSHPGKDIKEPADVNQLVRDATVLTRNRWKEVANLQLELEEGLPRPCAQAATLSQVVLNLIVNAADAIAENRKDPQELGTITLRSYADESSVYLEVEDDGPGIRPKVREKVFEPFFTTKDVGKGTGQGLSFSYEVIVRQHGGEIKLAPKSTPGCLFLIRIPNVSCAYSVSDPTENSSVSAVTI